MSDPTQSPAAPPSPADDITEDSVRLALRKVKDPELNLNIIGVIEVIASFEGA